MYMYMYMYMYMNMYIYTRATRHPIYMYIYTHIAALDRGHQPFKHAHHEGFYLAGLLIDGDGYRKVAFQKAQQLPSWFKISKTLQRARIGGHFLTVAR